MKKRILCFVLALLMLAICMLPACAKEDTPATTEEKVVKKLVCLGLVMAMTVCLLAGCSGLFNAILGKEKLFVDGKEGINGVQIMDAMLLSGFLGGKEVYLPIDDDLFLSELSKKIEEARKEK